MKTSANDLPSLVGFKEFRTDSEKYIKAVKNGQSFTILRRSKPVFRIVPIEPEWEVNFVDEDHPRGISLEELVAASEKAKAIRNAR